MTKKQPVEGVTELRAELLAPGEGTPEQRAIVDATSQAITAEQLPPEQLAEVVAATAARLIAPNESVHAAMADLGITAPFTVIACEPFGDNRTNRSYKPGDEVISWNRERAERYQKQGLVRIDEA